MGYEMYRLLSSKKVHLQKPKSRKKTPGSDVIDVEEVDRDKNLLVGQLLYIGLDKQKWSAKIVNLFLLMISSICFGCSKEPSH